MHGRKADIVIPRHSLPFGLAEALSLSLAMRPPPTALEVEQAYAEAPNSRTVLLFPSARAGIRALVEAAGGPQAFVVCPAYTCHVVHQALNLSGAQTSFVDSAPGSFLMPVEAVRAASKPDAVLVFCEMYGIPYDLDEIERTCGAGHRLRIFDMAMSIASPERIRRLGVMDAALYSFGWAKPMYAGRGGIVCLQDAALAA